MSEFETLRQELDAALLNAAETGGCACIRPRSAAAIGNALERAERVEASARAYLDVMSLPETTCEGSRCPCVRSARERELRAALAAAPGPGETSGG